jgi:hypothetical protein
MSLKLRAAARNAFDCHFDDFLVGTTPMKMQRQREMRRNLYILVDLRASSRLLIIHENEKLITEIVAAASE